MRYFGFNKTIGISKFFAFAYSNGGDLGLQPAMMTNFNLIQRKENSASGLSLQFFDAIP